MKAYNTIEIEIGDTLYWVKKDGSIEEIEVTNESTNTQDDLMEDFVLIITSFGARLYGKKPSQRKVEKIINELMYQYND